MPIVVDVRSPEDFKKWVDAQKADLAKAAAATADATAPAGAATTAVVRTAQVVN
jgi:heme/copper-type cytochrome/quinol oxidase subunit 2